MTNVDIRGTCAERKEKLKAVDELREYGHCFLSARSVAKFAKVFGVNLKPWRHKSDPDNPKGLTLNNGAKSAIGMDSCILALSICRQLNVPYRQAMGRGFQLHYCCDALEAHFRGIPAEQE